MSEQQSLPERLNEIVAQIKKLRSDHGILLKRSAMVAKEIGTLLIDAKKYVPKPSWRKWLAVEIELDPATVCRYMAISKQWAKIEQHSMFPALSVIQMYDVARGKEPRKRKWGIRDASLDVLLDILDDRLVGFADEDVPELEAVIEAIDNARPIMEKMGLLNRMVESRKAKVRQARRIADGSIEMESP